MAGTNLIGNSAKLEIQINVAHASTPSKLWDHAIKEVCKSQLTQCQTEKKVEDAFSQSGNWILNVRFILKKGATQMGTLFGVSRRV